MSLTLKIASLFVRTLAKPVANAIKRNAHEHERFRKICVQFAQGVHRVDMRMRLGLLQDPAVIDRQIAREVAEAEARRKKSQAPTVKTEAEMKAEEAMTAKEREEIRKKTELAHKPRIRPLSEAKAIETGANFVSEAFVFAVAISVIVFERWWSSRKEKGRHNDQQEEIEKMKSEMALLQTQLQELTATRTPEESRFTNLLGFFTGKPDNRREPTDPKILAAPVQNEIKAIKAEITTLLHQLDEVEEHIHQHSPPNLLEFWKSKADNHKAETETSKTTEQSSKKNAEQPPEPASEPSTTAK